MDRWKDSWELNLLVAYFSSTHLCALHYTLRQEQLLDAVILSVKAFPSGSPKYYA